MSLERRTMLDRVNKIQMIDVGEAETRPSGRVHGNRRAAPSLTVGSLPLEYFL
jgi:hypothetical protein